MFQYLLCGKAWTILNAFSYVQILASLLGTSGWYFVQCFKAFETISGTVSTSSQNLTPVNCIGYLTEHHVMMCHQTVRILWLYLLNAVKVPDPTRSLQGINTQLNALMWCKLSDLMWLKHLAKICVSFYFRWTGFLQVIRGQAVLITNTWVLCQPLALYWSLTCGEILFRYHITLVLKCFPRPAQHTSPSPPILMLGFYFATWAA